MQETRNDVGTRNSSGWPRKQRDWGSLAAGDEDMFEIEPNLLDFALWRHIKWGNSPTDREACNIRFNDGLECEAVYYQETASFGIGPDGEVRLHEVRWQPKYPHSIIERCARNEMQRLKAITNPKGTQRMTNTHGGPRPGAGRKPLSPEDKRVRVYVPKRLVEDFKVWLAERLTLTPNQG